MSPVEVFACRNPAWRLFTTRVVVPWVFSGQVLEGDVLELGTGAGANAVALLRRYPHVRLTATDVDPVMLESARQRLLPFSDRVTTQLADAASLELAAESFDAVVSMIMLHHVGDWRGALAEVARVLRPGGRFIGYDLSGRGAPGWVHRDGRHPGHQLVGPDDLREGLAESGFVDVRVEPGLRGRVARFSARRDGGA